MSWTVYILRCSDGTLYTGITNDLEARIDAHNNGSGAKYTRARRPVQLHYAEPAIDRSAASKREYQIKRLTRPAKHALAMSTSNDHHQ